MQGLENIYRLGLKELISLRHDVVLIVLMIYAFTIGVYVPATGSGLDLRNASVAIVDEDRSQLSARIADAFLPPYFQAVRYLRFDEIDRAMDAGQYTFVIDIPPNYQADVLAGRRPDIQVNVDATAMSQAGIGAGYVKSILTEELEQFLRGRYPTTSTARVESHVRVLFNPNLQSGWFMGVMQMTNWITMLAIVLTGAALIREREHGTIDHLLVMPVTPLQIILAKTWASGIVIVAAAGLTLWLVIMGALHVPVAGSIPLFFFGLILYLFCLSAIGIFLGTVARSMPQLGLLFIPIVIPMLLLSGGFTPLDSMPQVIQTTMSFSPSTHFVEFATAVLFRGAGLAEVWQAILSMAAIGAVFSRQPYSGFAKALRRAILDRTVARLWSGVLSGRKRRWVLKSSPNVSQVAQNVSRITISAIKEMAMLSSRVEGAASLAWGLPSFRTPAYIRSGTAQRLEDDPEVGKYTLPDGLKELRDLVAEKHRAEAGIDVDSEEHVLITAGNMQGLNTVFHVLTDPGDEIILTDPGFASHFQQIRLCGGEPVCWPLREQEGWSLDVTRLADLIGPRTKAIVLVSPSNPTGKIFSREELLAVGEIAKRNNVLILLDDPYPYFTYENKHKYFNLSSQEGLRDHVIYCFTFSKTYAMSGWRLGYMILPAHLKKEALKVHDATILCTPRISQIAGIVALQSEPTHLAEFQKALAARRELIQCRLDRVPHVFDYVKPEGAYYVFPRIRAPHVNSVEFSHRLLREAKVTVTPGVAFGPSGEHHVRMAFCVSEDVINTAFDRIGRYFGKN